MVALVPVVPVNPELSVTFCVVVQLDTVSADVVVAAVTSLELVVAKKLPVGVSIVAQPYRVVAPTLMIARPGGGQGEVDDRAGLGRDHAGGQVRGAGKAAIGDRDVAIGAGGEQSCWRRFG